MVRVPRGGGASVGTKPSILIVIQGSTSFLSRRDQKAPFKSYLLRSNNTRRDRAPECFNELFIERSRAGLAHWRLTPLINGYSQIYSTGKCNRHPPPAAGS
ncbi:hypothetical protein EVAR_63841_1 [Eumeta japonica]|uniref:Uncharacterized protein n=1 Tax=Eumeta variegata TaxID=151549 RepID=A0A4C1Z9G5_EUMVA|nr:hypothetical protein EVAR_63841_1 [Eumeta japonica]